METVTINDTKNEEWYIETNTCFVGPMCDLRKEWNSYHSTDRNMYYIPRIEVRKVDAEDVLEWIYERMDDDGYDNMAGMLWEETTDDFKKRLQSVLDEISNFGAAEVYYPVWKVGLCRRNYSRNRRNDKRKTEKTSDFKTN